MFFMDGLKTHRARRFPFIQPAISEVSILFVGMECQQTTLSAPRMASKAQGRNLTCTFVEGYCIAIGGHLNSVPGEGVSCFWLKCFELDYENMKYAQNCALLFCKNLAPQPFKMNWTSPCQAVSLLSADVLS